MKATPVGGQAVYEPGRRTPTRVTLTRSLRIAATPKRRLPGCDRCPTRPTTSTSCRARSGSTSRSRSWTTAYPSELGHARGKAHGANKPPRLMARLIEFFTRTGRARAGPVRRRRRDPARGRDRPRAAPSASGSSWTRAGRRSTRETVAARARRAGRRGAAAGGPGTRRSGRRAHASTRPAASCAVGDARELLPALPAASVDFVATDPPYNVQLPMTMAGGPLAETHANRRTDYAMVSELRATSPTCPTTPPSSDAMGEVLGEVAPRAPPGPVRRADRARRLPGRPVPVHGVGPAARADAAGLVPKGDIAWYQAGTRLRPVRLPAVVRAEHRAPAHRGAAQGAGRRAPSAARVSGEVGQQDVLVRRERPWAARCIPDGNVAKRHAVEPPLPTVGCPQRRYVPWCSRTSTSSPSSSEFDRLSEYLVGPVEEPHESVPHDLALDTRR